MVLPGFTNAHGHMKFNPPSRTRIQTKKNDPELEAGRIAVETCDWPTVQKIAQRRLRKSALDTFAHRYLGLSLEGLGQRDASIAAYERALKIYPDDVAVLINFSNVLIGNGAYQRAYDLSKRSTRLAPGMARTWITMLWPCYMLSKHQEAVTAAETARKLPMNPHDHVMMLNNLSTNLRDLGRVDEALEVCREAIQVAPDWPLPYNNLLLFLLSQPDTSTQDLKDVAELFSSRFETPCIPSWPTFSARDDSPHRRLRIGFLSPDFNQHPVMYFLEGLLSQLDRRQYETVALYTQTHEDQVTKRIRRHVDQFHSVAKLDDALLAGFIQELEIDILIDLAGHTAGSGLRAMKFKPAPVQVSWLGYPGTTGLKAIEWRFTDSVADQVGSDDQYTEKLIRLPHVFCAYRPLSRNPIGRYQSAYQVHPSPAIETGYVTFGSCNNLSKLTDNVLTTWAKVLARIPGSRLLIEGKGLDTELAKDAFREKCLRAGFHSDQLILIARDPANQYLTYNRIDVALDSFPLNGGNTTADLLWMGVPLVTMDGVAFRSRIGVSMLHCIGRANWIAKTEEEYVEIACNLVKDIGTLNAHRLAQRTLMESSPLMDEQQFTAHFQMALRHMWFSWCAERSGVNLPPDQINTLVDEWTVESAIETPEKVVTIDTGKAIPLSEAHQRLQALTKIALDVASREKIHVEPLSAGHVTHPAWLEVFELSEIILDSIPNEPLALATLAEIEHAHGRTDFASSYLRYAQIAIQNNR